MLLALSVAGCETSTDLSVPGLLVFGVESLEVLEETYEWAPYPIPYLRASVFAVNESPYAVRVEPSACVSPVRAFHVGEAAPVWSSAGRRTWPGSTTFACTLELVSFPLEPGDTLGGLAMEIDLAEILADSLPAAEYRFTRAMSVTVRVGSDAHRETAEVDLGEVTLPESRFPLWPDYPRDGFRYEVSLSPTPPPGVAAVATLEVAHTALYAGALTRDFSTCPLRLLAFASPEARETIPVPEPLWSWPPADSCEPTGPVVELRPGESRSFELDVPASALPPGRQANDFALMGIVEVDQRPIRLAVGS